MTYPGSMELVLWLLQAYVHHLPPCTQEEPLCPVFPSCTNPALMTNPPRNGFMLFNKNLSHAKGEVGWEKKMN